MGVQAIYVETRVWANLDRVWALTQDPRQHARWDLRFTHIDFLPRPDPTRPQEFQYAVRVAPGLTVAGVGRTLGERTRADGTRTSALGFSSDSPFSPIAQGRGYWRYVPMSDGVRFLTGYDYRARWGRTGQLVDRWAFRPAMGWATAWSFDRLRLWLETGQTPERSRCLGLADVGLRASAVLVGAALSRRAGSPVPATALIALVLVKAVSAVPTVPRVPRARRCLRRSPDRLGRTWPGTMNQVDRDDRVAAANQAGSS